MTRGNSTPVAPPPFFPSSGPGPVATSSAAHSQFAGREVRRPIHGLQCLGMPGNILGRLSGRESFVQHYSHLHTSHSPRSSSHTMSHIAWLIVWELDLGEWDVSKC